jgi:ADP-ribose pyrophosphatase YjhB (NUDIX family)
VTPVTPSRFRVGAYGLLVEGTRVLVTRTRTRLGPVQNFPGGALELGEGALDALRREFIEETGLTVRPLRLAYASESYHQSAAYPESQLVKLYWFVARAGGTLRPEGNGDDVEACTFVEIAALAAIGLTPADAEMVAAVTSAEAW